MKKTIVYILSFVILCMCIAGCTQNEANNEIADGRYSIEVDLEGGSGRACIESASVVIEGESVTAEIVWSSPFYEYMLVGDTKYEPIQTQGNSTFEIPVALDEKINVSASTVAMSQPYLIDYTLYFDSTTLKEE